VEKSTPTDLSLYPFRWWYPERWGHSAWQWYSYVTDVRAKHFSQLNNYREKKMYKSIAEWQNKPPDDVGTYVYVGTRLLACFHYGASTCLLNASNYQHYAGRLTARFLYDIWITNTNQATDREALFAKLQARDLIDDAIIQNLKDLPDKAPEDEVDKLAAHDWKIRVVVHLVVVAKLSALCYGLVLVVRFFIGHLSAVFRRQGSAFVFSRYQKHG
jgi:hypothetical protein